MSLFGAHIFIYSTSFSELHVPITVHVSFSNNQRTIDLMIGYSIILIFNVFSFALNVIRATCSATKIFTNFFFFLIYLQ